MLDYVLHAGMQSRVRWNTHVLGASAYPMAALPGADAYALSPRDGGVHLRWTVDPHRHMPSGGFYLYRRAHGDGLDPAAVRRPIALGALADGHRLYQVANEPGRLDVWTQRASWASAWQFDRVRVRFPTTAREVRVRMHTGNAEVSGFAGTQRVAWARQPEGAAHWEWTCLDVIDELTISGGIGALEALEWLRVPGDLEHWDPLASVPPLGNDTLRADVIITRLDGATAADAAELTAMVDACTNHSQLDWRSGSSGLAIDGYSFVTSTLTTRPHAAHAFGFAHVDPDAIDDADYLVVASWGRWLGRWPEENTDRARAGGSPVALPGVGLLRVIEDAQRYRSLLYVAPAYAVRVDRALPQAVTRVDEVALARERGLQQVTASGAQDTTAVVQAVRALDDAGHLRLHVPVVVSWSNHSSVPGVPLVASQEHGQVVIDVAGDVDPLTTIGHSEHDKPREMAIDTVVDAARADVEVKIEIRALSRFGHLGVVSTRSFVIPSACYPLPDAPAAFSPRLLDPASDAGRCEVRYLWGGRLRQYNPGIQRFVIARSSDDDLAALGQGEVEPSHVAERLAREDAWTDLLQLEPPNPQAVTVDEVGSTLTLHVDRGGLLVRDGLTRALLHTALLVGHELAPLSTWSVRVDTWTGAIGPTSVDETGTWMEIALGASASGTPFAALPQLTDAPTAFTNAAPVNLSDLIVSVPADQSHLTIIHCPEGDARFVPDALLTQGRDVFTILAVRPDAKTALARAVPPTQEPGGTPVVTRPALAAARLDAPTVLEIDSPVPVPTRARPRRRAWLRIATVDAIGRRGPWSPHEELTRVAGFKPLPLDGPTLAGASPVDRKSNSAYLVVRWSTTEADTGYVLHRADEGALRTAWGIARRTALATPTNIALASEPEGYAAPLGALRDIVDPFATFANSPQSLRTFLREAQMRVGATDVRVFDRAFERVGWMHRAGDVNARFAAANDDVMERTDTVRGARARYYYDVRAVDAIGQEGPRSGISDPMSALDIEPPAAPEGLQCAVAAARNQNDPKRLVVRWRRSADHRVTHYRIVITPLDDPAAATDVTEPITDLACPIRMLDDRIDLPDVRDLAGPRTVGAIVRLRDGSDVRGRGFLVPLEQRFAMWFASGARAVLGLQQGGATVPLDAVSVAAHQRGVADASDADALAIRLREGVVDGEGVRLAGDFADALRTSTGDSLLTYGSWNEAMLIAKELPEGTSVLVHLLRPDGTTLSLGRTPTTPTRRAFSVADGCIVLVAEDGSDIDLTDYRLGALYRADAVTVSNGLLPDPAASGAADLSARARLYRSGGFVRYARDRVPVVFVYTDLNSGSMTRILGAGTAELRFSEGVARVAPWNTQREILAGVYERGQLAIDGDSIIVPPTARNLLGGLVAKAELGRVSFGLADGEPVTLRFVDPQTAAVTDAHFSYEDLRWTNRELTAQGLLQEIGLTCSAVYALDPTRTAAAAVDLTDRIGEVDVLVDRLRVLDAREDGEPFEVRYPASAMGADEARTVDPLRHEYSTALSPDARGRSWRVEVFARCDFAQPVGPIDSIRPAAAYVGYAETRDTAVTLDSAAWVGNGQPKLDVRWHGTPGLRYTVEAVSEAGTLYVLRDNSTDTAFMDDDAIDGRVLPTIGTLAVRVRARFPHGRGRYESQTIIVSAQEPA